MNGDHIDPVAVLQLLSYLKLISRDIEVTVIEIFDFNVPIE